MPTTQIDRLSRELDWNLLRTFMVIVQEGSITKAADRLLLKQPTVSNALKRLEETLDRNLIERGPGVFRLTRAGDLFYRECVEVYGTISRLSVLLRDVKEEISGQVRIAMASHGSFPIFDETLAAFHKAHPRVTYQIDIDTSQVVVQRVLEKSASLGICLVHRRHPRLSYRMIYREHFGFFCGPGHRLFGVEGLTLKDLRSENFVSFNTDALTDALRPVALLRAQAEIEDRIVGYSATLEEVRRMIVAGLGIGPLPIHAVERDLRDGQLWQLPPYEEPPAIDIYLVNNPSARLNRAEELFLAALNERIEHTPVAERTYPRRTGGVRAAE